jgi:hypothetical protein
LGNWGINCKVDCTVLPCAATQAIPFVTPAFPGYVSGHATFSAAAAEVSCHFAVLDFCTACVQLEITIKAITPMKASAM